MIKIFDKQGLKYLSNSPLLRMDGQGKSHVRSLGRDSWTGVKLLFLLMPLHTMSYTYTVARATSSENVGRIIMLCV